MRLSKFVKNKVFRRIAMILMILCFVVLIDMGMDYMLSKVRFANYLVHDLQKIEASGEKTDIVFVGASRTHHTFVPLVFEEELGLDNAVNAACAYQTIGGCYYVVRDMIERFHPAHIVIGVAWNGMRSDSPLQSRLIVTDRLSLKNKLLMVLDTFDITEMPYLLSTYRFKDSFNKQQIQKNLEKKDLLARTDYEADLTGRTVYDKGFVYREGDFRTGNLPLGRIGSFYPERITARNLQYLDDCIELCRKNNVKVTLVSGITSVMRLYAVPNYQEAVDYFTAYAEKQGIHYYNLNYLRDRETFLPDELMYDTNHVGGEGAVLVSRLFAEVLRTEQEGGDTSRFFYRDLDEFKQSVHRIAAVKADITRDPADPDVLRLSIASVQNEDVQAVYRILRRLPEEDTYEVLRDWAPEKELELNLAGTPVCTLRVEAGSADETIGHAYQEYSVTPDQIGGAQDDASD